MPPLWTDVLPSAHMGAHDVHTHAPHLDHLLQKLVEEASDPSAKASNTVFVFREVLGQAYAAGHKNGHGQVMSQQWMVEDLHAAFAARRNKQQDAAPAPQDDQANLGG